MNDKSDQKRLMAQYLLGELSATERAALEEEYWKDDETFQELESLENELIGQYVLEELPERDRKQFEQAFLLDPARRQRVETAKSLLAYSEEGKRTPTLPTSAVQSAYWSGGKLVMAAGFLIMLGVILWLFFGNRQMSNELVKLRQQHTVSGADQQAVVQPSSRLQDVVPFALGTATYRGSGRSAPLRIPANASYVLLRISLEHDPHSLCDVVLEAADGALIWRQNEMKVQSLKDGTAEVVVVIPSHLLTYGDYTVTVSGRKPDSPANTIVGYSFHIDRAEP